MQIYSDEEQGIRTLNYQAREAIEHAANGNWLTAEKTNRMILLTSPANTDALNRLGKALSELGRYNEARDVFKETITHDPPNPIARKNLIRLQKLNDAPPKQSHQINTNLFISDGKKTYITTIMNVLKGNNCTVLSTGDTVNFTKFGDASLTAKTADNITLGELEPKIAMRLSRLITSGNQYTGTILSTSTVKTEVLIQEVYSKPKSR
jgi:tetratricopeptide (TPR) repeat protein